MKPEPILRLAPDGEDWLVEGHPWLASEPFLAVAGTPISHSLSPTMHAAALDAAGRPETYRAIEIDTDALALLRRRAHELGLRGMNLTRPLKTAALEVCDALTPTSRSAGAVNTVRIGEDGWEGHNTDVSGIRASLRDLAGDGDPEGRGLVFGAGGAARAAVVALLGLDLVRIEVRARPGASRAAFMVWLSDLADERIVMRDLHAPVGSEPLVAICSLPPEVRVEERLRGARGVFLDLRYGRQDPERPQGLNCADGLDVLAAQGADAFAWWFGGSPPRRLMREALPPGNG